MHKEKPRYAVCPQPLDRLITYRRGVGEVLSRYIK